MLQPVSRRSSERGQALVLFALTLTALIGLTGLVIDASSTYVQRRAMQNAADLAAMAAGYAYVNGEDPTVAADEVTQSNGYNDGTDDAVVMVTSTALNDNTANEIVVSITAPHHNFFSGVFGMASWNVSTTATVLAGIPNQVAGGALPLLFNEDLCTGSGTCGTGTETNPATYNEPPSGSQSVPTDTLQSNYYEFNWTVFCQANGNPCNANSSTVDGLLKGTLPTTQQTIALTDVIDPLNAGSHTTLFSDLSALVPGCYPVAMVDDSGALQGFATFCVTSAVGGNTKQIAGYFITGQTNGSLVIAPGGGTPKYYGSWAVYLTN